MVPKPLELPSEFKIGLGLHDGGEYCDEEWRTEVGGVHAFFLGGG